MPNDDLSGALEWLKHIANGCYVSEENGIYIVKKHDGGHAQPHEIPPRFFNYLLREGYLKSEGPEGESHHSFFVTEKGKAISAIR